MPFRSKRKARAEKPSRGLSLNGIRVLQGAVACCRSRAKRASNSGGLIAAAAPFGPEETLCSTTFGAGFEPATTELETQCSSIELAMVGWTGFELRISGSRPVLYR